ncbi:MAG: hypothetical protein ACOC5M_04040 [Chloroflexota bacterium]
MQLGTPTGTARTYEGICMGSMINIAERSYACGSGSVAACILRTALRRALLRR